MAVVLLTLLMPLQAFSQPTPEPVPTPAKPSQPEELTEQQCIEKYGDTLFVGVYGVNQGPNNKVEIDEIYDTLVNSEELKANNETVKRRDVEYAAPKYRDLAKNPKFGKIRETTAAAEAVRRFVKSLQPREKKGYQALSTLVTGVLSECKSQAIVFAGYSLGAWIVNDWLRANEWRLQRQETAGDLDAAVLLGDPQFREGLTSKGEEPPVSDPSAKPSLEYIGLAARAGRSIDPYPVKGWGSRIKSWCLSGDPVCGKGFIAANISFVEQLLKAGDCAKTKCPHLDYVREKKAITTEAGGFLVNQILNGTD